MSFTGSELTARGRRERRGDGESLLENWWEALRNDNQIGAAGAHLAQELSVFWIQLQNRAASLSSGQQTTLLQRLRALNVSKSIANAILLNEGEEVGEVARSTSGIGELSEDAKKRLAMVTGYPLAVLYGESPSGLNTDGDSHRKIWQKTISFEQRLHYYRPLLFLYECLFYAEEGGVPEDWDVVFHPLDELTSTEQAALEKTHAETDNIRITAGIISPQEARTRFGDTGYESQLTVEGDLEVEQDSEFEPHMMYDPETGEGKLAETYEEHVELGEKGWGHNKPDQEPAPDQEADQSNEADRGAQDSLESIDFSVPKGVKKELQKGLKWHAEGKSGDGLLPATVSWARRMVNGDPISPEKARKMRAWLARHETDKTGEGFKPGQKGFPSPGRVAWALWGGDPAVSWSAKIVRQIEAAEQS